MALLTAAEAQAHIRSDLTEAELQAVIDREEARMVAKLGPHGDGVTAVTVTLTPLDGAIFLPRPAASVTSIGGVAWASLGSGITLYGEAGRVVGGNWSTTYHGSVSVVYVPADDQEARKQALIDLTRIAVQRTAFKAESVAGEHSYTAPASWEAERAAIYRQLMYASI